MHFLRSQTQVSDSNEKASGLRPKVVRLRRNGFSLSKTSVILTHNLAQRQGVILTQTFVKPNAFILTQNFVKPNALILTQNFVKPNAVIFTQNFVKPNAVILSRTLLEKSCHPQIGRAHVCTTVTLVS